MVSVVLPGASKKGSGLLLALLVTMVAGFAGAETFTWTGAKDAYWTNAANWTVGGAVATMPPGEWRELDKNGNLVTNGVRNSTAEFGAVASGRMTLNMDGVWIVSNIVVKAGAPKYVFGSDPSQIFTIASQYGRFTVERGAEAPRIACNFSSWRSDPYPSAEAGNSSIAWIINNSSGVLDLDKFFYMPVDFPGFKRREGRILFGGCGDIRINGLADAYYNYQRPDLKFTEGARLIWNFSCDGQYFLRHLISIGAANTVEICKDCLLPVYNGMDCFEVQTGSSLHILGEGEMLFRAVKKKSDKTGGGLYQNGPQTINGSIKVDVKMTSEYSDQKFYGNWTFGSGDGTCEFSPRCELRGNIQLLSPDGGTLIVKSVGLGKETPTSVGYSDFQVGGGGTIRYTGTGETCDRALYITNYTPKLSNASATKITPSARIVQEGQGPLVWNGLIGAPGMTDDITLTLAGSSAAEAEIGTVLANSSAGGKLALVKSGSGVWRLRAANIYTGSTTLNGGVLSLAEGGSIAGTAKVVFNGGSLRVEGGEDSATVTLPTVEVKSGVGSLMVSGQATAVLPSVSHTGGTLNVVPWDGASAVFTDAALKGTTPPWLQIGGLPAKIDGEGRVVFAEAHEIAARGDVIPNAPGEPVAVTSVGMGEPTKPASADIAVGTLFDFVESPVGLAFAAGDTVTVDTIRIASGAGDFLLGTNAGTGTLASLGDLTLRNDSSASRLDVRASVAPTGVVRVDGGEGECRLSGGTADATGFRVSEGRLTVTGEKTFVFDGGEIGTNTVVGNPAKVVFDGAKDVRLGKSTLKIGTSCSDSKLYGGISAVSATDASMVEMVVTNSTIVSADPVGTVWTEDCTNSICVGHTACGALHIQAGAVITNRLMVGCGFKGVYNKAAVYQSGGDVVTLTGDRPYKGSVIGNHNGYGYYDLADGGFVSRGALGVGLYTVGVLYQHGGMLTVTNRLDDPSAGGAALMVACSNYGKGVWRMSGGTALFVGGIQLANGGNNSHAIGVIENGAMVDCLEGFVYLAGSGNVENEMKYGYLCLNSNALLRLKGFHRLPNRGETENAPLSRTVVGFDGGLLRLTNPLASDLFHPDGNERYPYGISKVYVYDGGVTVDTTEASGRFTDVPFDGATGGGVTGVKNFVPIPDLMGPPRVIIEGDGQDAVAVADYDPVTRTVTGITIAAPGSGYSWARAVFSGLCSDDTYGCVVAPNANTGSFTKAGAGDFTFKARNTYGGATVLKGGALVLGVPDALPANSPIVPQGGLLESTAANFPAEITVDVSGLDPKGRAVRFAHFTDGAPAALPKVNIVGSDDPSWGVRLVGDHLTIGWRAGLMMIVR